MLTFAPEGWHSVTPRLVVHDPPALVAFLKGAFGAVGDLHMDRPAEIWIGDSVVMVTGVGPREAMPSFLYLYLPDADAAYDRALALGATSVEAPLDTPYGDRRAMITDPSGNIWQIATRKSPI
jgi:uncharacterized glyoxalase superfamily protein PhnB